MKIILSIFLFTFISQVHAGEWNQLVGYTLYDIYSGKFSELSKQQSNIKRTTEVKGTSGLSWPDGRQAIVTYLETEREGKKWLFKCVDYFSKDMQQTGQACYELRK